MRDAVWPGARGQRAQRKVPGHDNTLYYGQPEDTEAKEKVNKKRLKVKCKKKAVRNPAERGALS